VNIICHHLLITVVVSRSASVECPSVDENIQTESSAIPCQEMQATVLFQGYIQGKNVTIYKKE